MKRRWLAFAIWLAVMLAANLLSAVIESCGVSKAGKSRTSGEASHLVPSSHQAKERLAQAPRALSRFKGDDDDDDSASNKAVGARADKDADFDNDAVNEDKSYYDGDDEGVRAWGKIASASDARSIASVVTRYYEAATAGDSAQACALLYSITAESTVEVYGEGTGPAYSRGHGCPTVMRKLLRHSLSRLFGPVTIVAVRTEGNRARAWLGSRLRPASYMPVRRERGAWKVNDLTPTQLP